MDNRNALPQGTTLAFPGMCCTVAQEIGRGSNAIVYRGSYPDQAEGRLTHQVLIKELYPFVQEGEIRRGPDLSLTCDEGAQEAWATHRLSFERGNESHLRLLESSPDGLGANLNTFPLNGTLYTVLGYNGGRSLEAALAEEGETTLRACTLRMKGILRALRVFHDAGCLHLDVSPDNILLIGRGEEEQIFLIDFNSVYSLAELQTGVPLYYSTKEGYTAPEVRAGRIGQIAVASDLYSAAAVFYRMIAGMALTRGQMLRKAPPDVSACPCMWEQTPTVQSMVKQILRRGLSALPRSRYQTIADMLTDMQELLDRIDGVGVTHWALWEAGKRTVSRLVRTNPALAHLRGESTLLPMMCRDDAGITAPVQTFIAQMASGQRGSALLTAPGGMGKTTALLDAVEKTGENFSSSSTAVMYVPLYGYHAGSQGDRYILSRVLEELRFSAEISTYEEARHALSRLMDAPLRTRQGEKPMLLLLLDGLNEAEGDTSLLLKEMAALCEKEGVCLLVTGRSGVPELPFAQLSLLPLTDADVQAELSRHGLLKPEDDAFLGLLHTPIMLHMFVRSALAEERQLSIRTADELIGAWLTAMLGKAQRELPEQSGRRWQLEAAVKLVLPAIAYGLSRHAGPLDHASLLQYVQPCFDLLPTRQLLRRFPAWTGHIRSIRGDAADAEAWFGLMVHELLWQQLGLVERDGQDCCRTNHQIISEYLLKEYRSGVGRLIGRRRTGRKLACAAAAAVLLATGWAGVQAVRAIQLRTPVYTPYPEADAKAVFEHAVARSTNAMATISQMRDLTAAAVREIESGQGADEAAGFDPGRLLSGELDYAYAKTRWQNWARSADYSMLEMMMKPRLASMLEAGEVMPWSGRPMDVEHLQLLMSDCTERLNAYGQHARLLDLLVTGESARTYYYPRYTELLSGLLDKDEQILMALYQLVCLPHEEGLQAWDAQLYQSAVTDGVALAFPQELYASAGQEASVLAGQVQVLLQERKAIEDEISASGILRYYERTQ